MFTDVPPQESDAGAPWPDGYPFVERRVELDIVRLADVQSPEDGAEAFAPQIVASENRRARPEVAPEARSDPETVRAVGSAVVSNEAVGTSPDASAPQEEHGAEAESEAPPADTGGGGRGNEPPDDTSGKAGEHAGEGDEGEPADREGTSQRRWASGEVRPAMRQVVALLAEKGISVDDALRQYPAQRDLVAGLLDEDVDIDTLAQEKGLTKANTYSTASGALASLMRAAHEAEVDPVMLPQPHGPKVQQQSVEPRPADPTKIVGPWLGATRMRLGVPVSGLAADMEVSENMLRRFFGAETRPRSPHTAEEIALTIGLEGENAALVAEALRAEQQGDYDRARAIIAGVQVPEKEEGVTEPGVPAGGDVEAPAEPSGPRRWAHGQQREVLRTLHEHGIDLDRLLADHARSAKTFRALSRMLPDLLSDKTNKEIAEEGEFDPTHISRMSKRLLDIVSQGVPQNLQHLLKPGGGAMEREPDPIGGELRARIQAAGMKQGDLADEANIPRRTLLRLLAGDHQQAHPAMALQPVLRALQERGAISPDEAEAYLQQYSNRRRRLISGDQET